MIPAGFALVPLELTDELRRAIWFAQYRYINETRGHNRPDADLEELVDARVNDPEQREMDRAAWKTMIEMSAKIT